MKKRNIVTDPVSSEKGITLIALIITIVVMLILVGVTVRFTIGENGILSQTKEAKKEYEIGQLKEIFSSNYSLKYYQKTGYWPSDEAITKIAEASIETGVDVNKFIVYHDKHAIAQNEANKDDANYEKIPEEYTFYNWNKVTLEEMEKLEVEYTPSQAESSTLCNLTNRCFTLDATGDGYFDDKDLEEIRKIVTWIATNTTFDQDKYNALEKMCFDEDQNNTVDKVIYNYCEGEKFSIIDGIMFLWQPVSYNYYEFIENTVYFIFKHIYEDGRSDTFSQHFKDHIYYNSGRVPLEQEITQ